MPEDYPTRADYFEIGRAELQARAAVRPPNQRLDVAQVDVEGSDLNIAIAWTAAMADESTRHLKLRMATLYLDSAEGEDLDRLVADRFAPAVVRNDETPAVVTLELGRFAGAFPAVNLPIGTKVRGPEGVEFETTQVGSVPLGSSGPIPVLAQSTSAGLQGNVGPNTLTKFVEPVAADPNLQVTNPEAAGGGDAQESDERLRERAREFFRQARRGTVGAIEFGALTVGGIRQASALEVVDDLTGIPTGVVQLYLADANGQANAALRTAVINALTEYRGAGVVVDVFSGSPFFADVVYALAFVAGTDTVAAFESIRQRTVAEVNRLRPNETLERALLGKILVEEPGVRATDSSIVTPAGDLVPSLGQVIRTTADRVTRV